ncbi:hypothetical protein KVT40_005602 [Elsinoe batatas]|uniref:1,3-beta-glucanosyltransferase n=1 Tax=Elsinoe batatas TaxID=2601811 RepID=A0A8K0PFL0_9PEZI|nr:hypothetical protein KVT40_005602 [Elsinoe batatas]
MASGSSCVPITLQGRHLLRGDRRFFIRGVVYQIADIPDPLADDNLHRLEQDIKLFKKLGLNTISVYQIDHSKSHDAAMKNLEQAGIYVIFLLGTPKLCINRLAPYACYTPGLMRHYCQTLHAMAPYPNTLGALVGSELINSDDTIRCAPVIKAVVRDLKRYQKLRKEKKGQRVLPLGYDAAATGERGMAVLRFLLSGGQEGRLDFWTCKGYGWANHPDKEWEGYRELSDQLSPMGIPMWVAEYGNNAFNPRKWKETPVLYSEPMTKVFSGGLAYEMWQAANQYGLVGLLPDEGDERRRGRQQALRQANNDSKVAERRRREGATLLIFHDFVNYKKMLAEVEGTAVERQVIDSSGAAGSNRSEGPRVWPWEPDNHEPPSCVAWDEIEDGR